MRNINSFDAVSSYTAYKESTEEYKKMEYPSVNYIEDEDKLEWDEFSASTVIVFSGNTDATLPQDLKVHLEVNDREFMTKYGMLKDLSYKAEVGSTVKASVLASENKEGYSFEAETEVTSGDTPVNIAITPTVFTVAMVIEKEAAAPGETIITNGTPTKIVVNGVQIEATATTADLAAGENIIEFTFADGATDYTFPATYKWAIFGVQTGTIVLNAVQGVKEITIRKADAVATPSGNITDVEAIYVPRTLVDAYVADANWAAYKDIIVPIV